MASEPADRDYNDYQYGLMLQRAALARKLWKLKNPPLRQDWLKRIKLERKIMRIDSLLTDAWLIPPSARR